MNGLLAIFMQSISLLVLSAIVDNVPLVAGSVDGNYIGRNFAQDGVFWQFLAFVLVVLVEAL